MLTWQERALALLAMGKVHLCAAAGWVWRAACTVFDLLGNPKTKNALLVILLCMTAFGMLAPDTATALRDLVLAMVF
jgi:hypothetical protein